MSTLVADAGGGGMGFESRSSSFSKTTTVTTTTTTTTKKAFSKKKTKAPEPPSEQQQQQPSSSSVSNAKLCTLDDLDDLLSRLSQDEIEELARVDPDDHSVPASLRCSYACGKPPTPKLDRAGLLRSLRDGISPDREETVAFVPGVVRGKKFKKRETKSLDLTAKRDDSKDEEKSLDDLSAHMTKEEAEQYERFFEQATMDDLREIADILGLIYQDNCCATELKVYPDPEPNESDVEMVVRRAGEGDQELTKVNFNNLNCVSADHWRRLCSAVASKRGKISHLSAANCELTDARAKELAEAMREAGDCCSLTEVTLDSNLLSGSAVLDLVRAGKGLTALRVSNQLNSRYLGHRIESSIADLLSSGNNPRLVNLGLNMEFRGCLNRVAVQLQANLDKRRKAKLKKKSA